MTSPHEPPDDVTARRGMEGLIAAMRGRRGASTVDVRPVRSATMSVREGELAEVAWRALHVRSSSGVGEDEGCADDEAPAYLERGAVVGRYVVLRELGAGGMGVVYAAYDPELDRKVALKLVLPGRGDAEGRTRLLREAQALARLSHRNVVAVHDVGTMGGQVWLALEFVRGQTLREWLRTPRSWREVLGVLRKAGRGLAAAHAAGLLHRDFKPDNVMVGARGRVRVMDFGLARARGSAVRADESTIEALPVVDTLALAVTQAGTLLGTPVYMAPEQLLGREPTPAVDQYALCVTLWEALYGERPFGGDALDELVEAVIAGHVRAPTSERGVPGWLRRVCERGLSTRPEQRFESMEALLDALAKGQARARLHKGLAAVGALALLGLGGTGWQRWDHDRRAAACEASGDEVAEAWNDERRQALHDALLATGVSHAATTAEKVMPWLDRQAAAWRGARVEACLDAEVRGRWDARMLERSLWCLDERRTELASLVDELTRPDATVVQKAVTAATELASVEPCRDDRTLEALGLPSPDQREAIRAIRAMVTWAGNLERAGRYETGLGLARDALARAEALAWRPLVAAARHRLGSLLERVGDLAEAETALEDAYFAAGEGVAPVVAVDAATTLAFVVGVRLGRHAEGQRWGRHAELALASVGDGEGLQRAVLLRSLATLHDVMGAYEEAVALQERALAIFERLGPEHPEVGSLLDDLAMARASLGSIDDAKRLEARAIDIHMSALGPEHPTVASELANLAELHRVAGSYEEAKALHERALASFERALGSTHPDVAISLNALAVVHEAMGAHARALALQERALAILEAALGPTHRDVAMSLHNLANVHCAMGAYDEALPLYERALASWEAALGPEHPHVAYPLVGLAKLALEQGRPADAVPLAQRAVAIRQGGGASAAELAVARFALARASWEAPDGLGRDRPRAVRLAEQAEAAYREAGSAGADALAEVEAWRAAHVLSTMPGGAG